MSRQPLFVESLETRRLLSANPLPNYFLVPPGFGPVLAKPVKATTPAGENRPGRANPAKNKPVVTAPAGPVVRSTNLVGKWDGEVTTKILFIRKSFDLAFAITEQTATTITGQIEIAGREVDGTFKGKINPRNGRFAFRLKEDDASVKIEGRLNARATAMAGEISAKYKGFKVGGKFEMRKV